MHEEPPLEVSWEDIYQHIEYLSAQLNNLAHKDNISMLHYWVGDALVTVNESMRILRRSAQDYNAKLE